MKKTGRIKKGTVPFLLSLILSLEVVSSAEAYPYCIAQNFSGIKQINGTGIYCKVLGTGTPLIVVHGGPGLAHNYLLRPFSQLAKDYRLIFYDQHGNGLSDEFIKGQTVTVQNLVEELEAVRKEFAADEDFFLAGQSWGAVIAISYIAKYPQHVKKLMLLEPAPGSSEYIPEFQKRIAARLSQEDKEELRNISTNPAFSIDPQLYKRYRSIWFKTYYFDPKKMDNSDTDYMDGDWLRKFHASSVMFTPYLLNFDLYNEMKAIRCPMLIIHGEYDVVPNESIEKMKLAVPAAELHIIKDCGHFVHVEKERDYFTLIKEFLKR